MPTICLFAALPVDLVRGSDGTVSPPPLPISRIELILFGYIKLAVMNTVYGIGSSRSSAVL